MTVRIATCSEVRDRLRYLKRKIREEAEDQVIDIDTRLERNKDIEEREREERRRKRNEKRRKTKDPLDQFEIKIEGDGVIS
jgi:U4/U6.U5 tri-snRNP component SNU23